MGLQQPSSTTRASRLRMRLVRLRYLFLGATMCVTGFLIITINSGTNLLPRYETPHRIPQKSFQKSDNVHYDNRFSINTEGCTIPALKPFDESIVNFVKEPNNLKPCSKTNHTFLMKNETHIWINTDSFTHLNLSQDSNVTCCYKPFYRPSLADVSSRNVDDRVQYLECITFDRHIAVTHEFAKVSCYSEDNFLHEQFFLNAIEKAPNFAEDEDIKDILLNKTNYNVIIMGIDAVSRLNFYRTMPKTSRFLKNRGAIELLGYNKVGDNTFPNIIPMLLGIKDTDLKKTCWPRSTTSFDNCPFVWMQYKDAGFQTALGEDSATLGTFNFEKIGFVGSPTDYYIHPFIHEAEQHSGNNKDFNSYICMGESYFYKILLDYIESLLLTLKSFRLFGFFWETTMSHDYLNYPMLMDANYERFFKKINSYNVLEDTIIFLLSDHGIRWGDIRFTKQGRLEERLPLMLIILPQSFKTNYSTAYENLIINSERLTTPFDIHKTLNDLIDLDVITNENIHIRSKEDYSSARGISLFLQIPRNRTCNYAGIEDHWCTCHNRQNISKDSNEAHEAAKHLVDHINMILRPYQQCVQLILNAIVEITEMMVGIPDQKEVGWREFMIVVRTSPGNGVFEATIRHNSKGWSVSGTVSRINLYGTQSQCIHDYQIKLYCYCV